MGYWGTIVLARGERSITEQPAVAGFGWRHQQLRDLGGGWQLLETGDPLADPPDLVAAVQEWVKTAGTPVLAAYVCDSDCAGVSAATPAGDGWSMHLPDPGRPCGVHGSPPAERAAGAAAAWARDAGLEPSPSHLDWLTGPEPRAEGDGYVSADSLVFELVLALGIAAITPPRAAGLEPASAPYHLITDRMGGLGHLARNELAAREHQGVPPEAWMSDALRLERDIWAARFDTDAAELAARAERVHADYLAAVQASGPPAATVNVRGREVTSGLYLGYQMHQMLARGSLNNPAMAAMSADRRHEAHPIRRR